MAKLSALVIGLSMCVPLVMLYWVPMLFKDRQGIDLQALALLAGLNIAPYGVLLLVCYRSRRFRPGLVVAGLVAVGLATLHAHDLFFVITELHTDAQGGTYRYTDAQGGLGYLFYLIFQLVAIVAPVGLGIELAHLVRRWRQKVEASGAGRSSVPEERDSPQ